MATLTYRPGTYNASIEAILRHFSFSQSRHPEYSETRIYESFGGEYTSNLVAMNVEGTDLLSKATITYIFFNLWGTTAYFHDIDGVVLTDSWPTLRSSADFYNVVVEQLFAGSDIVDGRDANFGMSLSGYGGADSIFGSPHDDSIYGQDGADRLEGFAGADDVYGGDGDDLLLGGTDADILGGGDGDDQLDGGSGSDELWGGGGSDILIVDNVRDRVNESTFDVGRDTVVASVSFHLGPHDSIEVMKASGLLALALSGNRGNQRIHGNAIANSLDGKGGNDSLNGYADDDLLRGGKGRDTLVGGPGNDHFDFDSIRETKKTSATRDVIRDFTPRQDKIDLATIDANGTAPRNGRFSLVADEGAVFTGGRGQLTFDQVDSAGTSRDKTIIFGDIDGDRVADFTIELTGLKSLVASDFVL